ncbi:hypothetical protein JCM8202v2_000108 [Rhodotorula sphaerocarpa]
MTSDSGKVLLNDSVVAQNEGWTGTSVQWRGTEEQVPVGTSIMIRILDSGGQMVLSGPTTVVAGETHPKDGDNDKPDSEHAAGRSDEGGSDGSAKETDAHLMDDPNEAPSSDGQVGAFATADDGGPPDATDTAAPAAIVPASGVPAPAGAQNAPVPAAEPNLGGAPDPAGAPEQARAAPLGQPGPDAAAIASVGGNDPAAMATAVAGGAAPTADPSALSSGAEAAATSTSTDSQGSSTSSATPYVVGVCIAVVLVFAALGFYFWRVHRFQSLFEA